MKRVGGLCVMLITFFWGMSSANATSSSLWFQFVCIPSGPSVVYSMQMNTVISTTTVFDAGVSNVSCNTVCVYFEDRDGDGTDETDSLYDTNLVVYRWDLDLDFQFPSSEYYYDFDTMDYTEDNFTAYCWTTSWDDGDYLVKYSSVTEVAWKAVLTFTDEGDNVRTVSVVPGTSFANMWP